MKIQYLNLRIRALWVGFLISIIPIIVVTITLDILPGVSAFVAVLIVSFSYSYRIFKDSQGYLRVILHSVASGLLAQICATLQLLLLPTVVAITQLSLTTLFSYLLTSLLITLVSLFTIGIFTSIYMIISGSVVYLFLRKRQR